MAKRLLHSVYNPFFPTLIEVISGNYLFLIKAITGHMIEHLYTGRADIRSHSCFKNKPFISVIGTFFTLDDTFVCPNTDRQANKNSYSPVEGKKNRLCFAGGSLITAIIKVQSYCGILPGRGTSVTTDSCSIQPAQLGCLIFSSIVS